MPRKADPPDYIRDIALTGKTDLFQAPFSGNYWIYNISGSSIQFGKSGKALLACATDSLQMVYLEQGEELRLIGTAGTSISILNRADAKILPSSSDILGIVELADGTGNLLTSATAAPASNARGLVVRFPNSPVIISGQPILVTIGSQPISIKQLSASSPPTFGQTAIGATATLIVGLNLNNVLIINNNSSTANSVNLGGSGVTVGTGYELKKTDPGLIFIYNEAALFNLYGISALGTENVSWAVF